MRITTVAETIQVMRMMMAAYSYGIPHFQSLREGLIGKKGTINE